MIRRKYAVDGKCAIQSAQVRKVAEKLAEVNSELEELPPLHRQVAIDLSEKLRNISQSLASAAELGAATSHRLNALANSEVAKVDDADPLESIESLKSVGVLTKLANDSASIALNLLAANKEAVQRLNGNGPSVGDTMPVFNITLTEDQG